MEAELRTHLLALCDAFIASTGRPISTVSQSAAGDWRFFDKLRSGTGTFRVRTYDRAVAWFAARWPAEADWPSDVPRPNRSPEEAL